MRSVLWLTAWLMLSLAPQAFGATVEYLHTDALGSVVAVSNSAGTVIERREYEPYGRQLVPAVPEDGPAYTGHVSDAATALSYMQQRYYDPGIGRFLSVDPVDTYEDGDYRHFNRYSYAYNNPYVFSDPDGRKGKIGWAVELGTTYLRKGARVTLEQAVKIRKAGGNFLGDSTRISRRVETTAHGRSNRIRHSGHDLKDESGVVAGKGFPHYQTEGVSGHSFINKAASVILTFGAIGLSQVADAADNLAEVADSIDPYRIADAGIANECSSSCGVTDSQLRSLNDLGGLEGFQGVFRVNGRIESKRLNDELDDKR